MASLQPDRVDDFDDELAQFRRDLTADRPSVAKLASEISECEVREQQVGVMLGLWESLLRFLANLSKDR